MKGIVMFKSKYGATRKYAQWISQELGFPMREADAVSATALSDNDVIVLGSSVYIGKLLIKSWLLRYTAILLKKKIFLFVVCGTPANEKDKTDQIIAHNLPPALAAKCKVFFLRGSLQIDKVSWLDRLALRMAASVQKDPSQKQAMIKGYDDVKIENIAPLTDSVKKFIGSAMIGAEV